MILSDTWQRPSEIRVTDEYSEHNSGISSVHFVCITSAIPFDVFLEVICKLKTLRILRSAGEGPTPTKSQMNRAFFSFLDENYFRGSRGFWCSSGFQVRETVIEK